MDATADDWMFDGYDGDEEGSGNSDSQDKESRWGNSLYDKVAQERERRKQAEGLGRASEGSAANQGPNGHNSLQSAIQNARSAEGGGFANNVKGKALGAAAAKAVPGGKMLMAQAQRLGPLGTILGIVVILIGVFSGTQALAPFGLIANGLDQFNPLRTVMNKRTTYMTRFKLNKSRNKPVTKASIFYPEHFSVSKKLQKKLATQGVYYFDENNSDYKTRFMVYTDESTGKRYAVSANGEDIGDIPDKVRVKVDGVEVEIDGLSKMKIDDALLESKSFSRSFDVGTRTLKGHIAGWFDDLSAHFHKRIGSSRNKRKDTSKTDDDEEVKRTARRAEDGGVDEGMNEDVKPDKEAEGKYEDYDEDGKPFERNIDESDTEGVKKSETRGSTDFADIEAKINNSFTKKAQHMVGAIGSGVNYVCIVLKVYSAINIIIAGIHAANILNYLTGFLEAIQKTQVGDAGENELSYYMTGLSQKGNTYDIEGENIISENKSSLESDAWNQFFSSGSVVVQADDKVAQKFNQDYVATKSMEDVDGIIGELGKDVGSLMAELGGAIAAYEACLGAQMVADGISAVIDMILAFFTGGIGNFIKYAIRQLFDMGTIRAIVTAIIGAMAMSVIPHVAKWMAMDLISDMSGEDAAYAINSGFNMYGGGQMQASSGLPATADTLMAHWRVQQEVIAEEAELERNMKSPFDPTSKYTFVGSIVNSLMPIANTWSSPLTTISKTVNTVGTSLMNLRPTANAEGEAVFETSLNYECQNLSQIGLVGDAFCNPYFVTDVSTLGVDPSDVIDAVSTEDDKKEEDGNFLWGDERGYIDTDGDGETDAYNPPINPDSDLGKWVISCAARDSGFGIVDSNVMNSIVSLTDNPTLDTAIEVGTGAIPIVGNVVDIITEAREQANLDWATGENCTKEEYKYYSRYSEDQRYLESSGIIEESTVAMFLDDYYKKNPIDDSYEGLVARRAGMTTEQYEETMAYVEAFEWLANYNPTNYGPEKPLPVVENYQYESNDIVSEAEKAVVGNYVIYDDLRTKIKVV